MITVALVGLIGISCGATGYKYYGLNPLIWDGDLLGPAPEDDIPFSTCQPDDAGHKCVVLFVSEWEKVQRDIIEMRERLKACED